MKRWPIIRHIRAMLENERYGVWIRYDFTIIFDHLIPGATQKRWQKREAWRKHIDNIWEGRA